MNRRRLRVLPALALLLPFDLLVVFGLLMAEIIGLPLRLFKRKETKGNSEFGFRISDFEPAYPKSEIRIPKSEFPSVTIIIVSWDGKELLEESLPHVVEAARDLAEVLVVDNGSSDGSVEFIRRNFPGVRVLELDKNYGFTAGNNRGARSVQTDIVVFLNNDMIVDRSFLKPLLDGFSDPAVFAVTSQIFFQDESRSRDETGNTQGLFEKGFFKVAHRPVTSPGPVAVFWAGGGSSAVDRRKFSDIGGFDPLYHPFYVEDMDLSYQAWKRGWKCTLMPSSKVIHKHRGTSRRKFGNDFVDNTILRNQYLFVWKNVTDISMILEHVVNLPRIHGRTMLERGQAFEIKAFLRAVSQLPEALWKRLSNLSRYALTDREVLARSRKS